MPIGPLAPVVLDECRAWMAAQGYVQDTTAMTVNLLQRLSAWMQAEAVDIGGICDDSLEKFIEFERTRPVVATSVNTGMGTLRRFLRAAGYMPPEPEPEPTPANQTQLALVQWCSWMRTMRGLDEKTIRRNLYYGEGLIESITDDDGEVQWSLLEAPMVNAYIQDRGRPYGLVARALIVGTVRCLIR